MKAAANNDKSFSTSIPAEGQTLGQPREEYSTPRLTEFGSIKKLTHQINGSLTV